LRLTAQKLCHENPKKKRLWKCFFSNNALQEKHPILSGISKVLSSDLRKKSVISSLFQKLLSMGFNHCQIKSLQ